MYKNIDIVITCHIIVKLKNIYLTYRFSNIVGFFESLYTYDMKQCTDNEDILEPLHNVYHKRAKGSHHNFTMFFNLSFCLRDSGPMVLHYAYH